jgi:hypothetical protein
MNMIRTITVVNLMLLLLLTGCEQSNDISTSNSEPNQVVADSLSDEQIENIVFHSYPFVAMYNVNNKFALGAGGWNRCETDTKLKDHTMKDIARPNNDTLYLGCVLDLRKDAAVLSIPAFDSKYVSLMVTGYDHYVNIPLSVTKGDFKKPEKVLLYTERTEGFDGRRINGIDRNFEMTGDFVTAIIRVMPHANDKARFDKILEQMQSFRTTTLSEFQGKPAKSIDDIQFPSVGQTDSDVYENNFLEVMQFVVNHASFDPNDKMDNDFLATMKMVGIEPGKSFDEKNLVSIDGKRFRAIADKLRERKFARAMDPEQTEKYGTSLFLPKGQIPLDLLVLQSVIGPIGQPATEAIYPPVPTEDGNPMNAMHDYVIRMDKDQMPPAKAFWSMTLYDSANGFFIPNDRKKYSVGENAGMKLDDEGGIEVYVAAQQPEGVPEENWLPVNRKDENLDIILRIYNPDLEKYREYTLPKAVRVK